MDANSPTPNVKKTILELDLVAYSDVARMLEENLSVDAVRLFEDQVQEFVDSALKQVGLERGGVVLGTAGDNAILVFDNPLTMHQFAAAVQSQTVAHNETKSVELAKRWFRMGAATGLVMVLPSERRIVGTTIARAVRLEAAGNRGQLLIDLPTFNGLPEDVQRLYGASEVVYGKRDERFECRRCIFVQLPAIADHKSNAPDHKKSQTRHRYDLVLGEFQRFRDKAQNSFTVQAHGARSVPSIIGGLFAPIYTHFAPQLKAEQVIRELLLPTFGDMEIIAKRYISMFAKLRSQVAMAKRADEFVAAVEDFSATRLEVIMDRAKILAVHEQVYAELLSKHRSGKNDTEVQEVFQLIHIISRFFGWGEPDPNITKDVPSSGWWWDGPSRAGSCVYIMRNVLAGHWRVAMLPPEELDEEEKRIMDSTGQRIEVLAEKLFEQIDPHVREMETCWKRYSERVVSIRRRYQL